MNIELNQKLNDAIMEDVIDLAYVEELLSLGANPLGPLVEYKETCTLAEIFCVASEPTDEQVRKNMPKLVGLFLEHGMQPADIREKGEDRHNSDLTLWSLSFCCSKESTETLKLLLDNGLNVRALEDFVSHFYLDAEMVYRGDDDFGEYYLNYLTYGFKMIMLSASYPEVLNSSEYLRSCIEMDSTNKGNTYDLTKFADYDGYDYVFDISTCDHLPFGLRNTTVEIYEKGHQDIVWKMYI